MILLHPRVEGAVFEVTPGEILTDGLGFDRCEVAVVSHLFTDPSGPPLDDLAEAAGVLLRAVVPGGTVVVNAADPKVAAMARGVQSRVIAFAVDGDCPEIARRRAAGECVVFVRDGRIVTSEGVREETLSGADRIPPVAQVENVLAAIAAAWALSIPWPLIRSVLETPTGTDL